MSTELLVIVVGLVVFVASQIMVRLENRRDEAWEKKSAEEIKTLPKRLKRCAKVIGSIFNVKYKEKDGL